MRCPLCHTAFVQQGNSLRCESGHCYDIAAKGYVNLLPNQKKTKYTRPFFEARAAVFAAGLYDGIATALQEVVRDWLGEGEEPALLLDAGCGEGSYCKLLGGALPRLRCYGMDLEKEAVRVAARNARETRFLVGDLANMPLQDACVDVLLNSFTPANYAEFRRVLRPNGLLVKIVPGPGHMRELRELLGMQAEESGSVEALFCRECIVWQRIPCGGTYPLDAALQEWLLAMTPLLFDVPESQRRKINLQRITIDGVLLAGRLQD